MEQKTRYLILSGEGHHSTEHQFVMECDTLDEANKAFDEFKGGGYYDDTYLFIYEAVMLREG